MPSVEWLETYWLQNTVKTKWLAWTFFGSSKVCLGALSCSSGELR